MKFMVTGMNITRHKGGYVPKMNDDNYENSEIVKVLNMREVA